MADVLRASRVDNIGAENEGGNMTKLALVTGASRGLGATISTFLAGMGYDLILTARGVRALEAHAGDLRELGVGVEAIAGDVADADHQMRLVRAASERSGLDLLINNASDLGPSPLLALHEIPLNALRRIHEVNFIAPLALIQQSLPLLKARNGWIVNISSDAAIGGYEGWGGYGSSKAALDLASLTLANELKEVGISVVSVDPGDMRTDMHQLAFPGEDISDRPLPDETLPFWAWLLSQEPALITGSRFQAQAESWELGVRV